VDQRFRTKGQLAVDILGDAYADGLVFDFVCGDEVYGSCTELREYLEGRGQAYVLRVAANFALALAAGTKMICAEAVKQLLKRDKAWEVRSAGKGSKGERWYACAWLATASPRHSPAHPPSSEERRAGLSLLFRPAWAGGVQGPADQGSGAALAGRGELRAC
jgi:SRSO17 transposase